MSRITAASKCRLCKAEGVKLYLKGTRCFSPKCPLEKKGAITPGMHGLKRSKKPSDYGLQLRAKQKAKRLYGGITEAQFRNYFVKAKRLKGLVGNNLLSLLERRLDNAVFLSGLSLSRSHARSLVSHGHFTVNQKIVDIPSYSVKVGDEIVLSSKIVDKIGDTLRSSDKDLQVPEWIEVNKSKTSFKIISMPQVDPEKLGIDINLIIEYFSR